MNEESIKNNNLTLVIPSGNGIEIIYINTREVEYFSFEEAIF